MLERITSIDQLERYRTHLLKLFYDHRDWFDEYLTPTTFWINVLRNFTDDSNLSFGVIENDELVFFVCTSAGVMPEVKIVWICYMNPKFMRTHPMLTYLDEAKKIAYASGIQSMRLITARLTRSYRRFASKIGAKLLLNIYEMKPEN